MKDDGGWLKKEVERAKERASKMPTQARPVVVRGSFASGRAIQGKAVAQHVDRRDP